MALHGPDVTQPPQDPTDSQQRASSWAWLLSQSCTQVVSRKTSPYLLTVNTVMEKAMGEKITGTIFKMLQQNQTSRGGRVPQRRAETRPAQRVSLGDGSGTTVTLCPIYPLTCPCERFKRKRTHVSDPSLGAQHKANKGWPDLDVALGCLPLTVRGKQHRRPPLPVL